MACSKSKLRRQCKKRALTQPDSPKKANVVESLRYPLLSTTEYDELTLEFYKYKRGPEHADYKIVRVLGSCRVLANAQKIGVYDWCHVSFIASRKFDGNDAKEVLFFSELVDFGYGYQLVLNNFSILKLDDPNIIYGCGFCQPDEDHPHPRDAYYAGEWDYEPTNETSQKEMAIKFEQHLIHNQKNQISSPYFNLKCGLLFKPEPFEDVVLDPSLRSPLFSTLEYAKLALERYKEEEGIVATDYEIVQALGSCVLLQVFKYDVADWCHVSFTAKPRNSDCNDDIVLFFAELVDLMYGDRLSLNYFSISKPDAPGITYGCGFCPPGKDHPHLPNAYFAGRCESKTTNEYTSQEQLAICFQRQVISKRKDKNRNKYARQTMWRPKHVEPDPSRFSPMLSDHEYARIALSYISNAEEVEYELVRTMYYNRQSCLIGMSGYGQWCHVYFIAEPKTADDSLVHFFAELNDPGIRKFNLSTYSKMDPNGVGMDEGCGICPISEKYHHPATGLYIGGSWPHFGCLPGNYLHCNYCRNRNDSDDF